MRFWDPSESRKVQWMMPNGESFDLKQKLLDFFNREDENLGNSVLFLSLEIFFKGTKTRSLFQTKKTDLL